MNFKERLNLISPLNWPIWGLLGLLWSITLLPISWQYTIGKGIGRMVYHIAGKLRKISEKNIAMCFPHYTKEQQTALVKKNFDYLGIGIIETGMAWWLSDKRLAHCKVTITGHENTDTAFAKGNGIVLLGPHCTCVEMVGRLLGSRYSFALMYRPHKKHILSYVQERFRKKYRIKLIARSRMRELVSTLQDNTAIWYAYDVDGGEKRSVFAPFFGIQTASLNAVSRFVEMTKAAIVPINFYRREDCWGYQIDLLPQLENFPTQDYVEDATRLNAVLEKAILVKPEQYIWQYKRFKTRPPGEKKIY